MPSVQTPIDFLSVFFAEAADEQLIRVHESGRQRRSGSPKRSDVSSSSMMMMMMMSMMMMRMMMMMVMVPEARRQGVTL